MRRALQIVNIDGLEGIGKTTQVSFAKISLSNQKIPAKTLHLNDTVESAIECAFEADSFLDQNPEGVVIVDGSIARMITKDMISGMSQLDVQEKYRDVIFEYERLTHKYGTLNVLMISDDIDECHRRLTKRNELLGEPILGIEDMQKEKDIIKGLRSFDDNVISKSVNFKIFEVRGEDSILQVKDDLWKFLSEYFDLDRIPLF